MDRPPSLVMFAHWQCSKNRSVTSYFWSLSHY